MTHELVMSIKKLDSGAYRALYEFREISGQALGFTHTEAMENAMTMIRGLMIIKNALT